MPTDRLRRYVFQLLSRARWAIPHAGLRSIAATISGESLKFKCQDTSDAAYCKTNANYDAFLTKYRKDSYKAKAFIHQVGFPALCPPAISRSLYIAPSHISEFKECVLDDKPVLCDCYLLVAWPAQFEPCPTGSLRNNDYNFASEGWSPDSTGCSQNTDYPISFWIRTDAASSWRQRGRSCVSTRLTFHYPNDLNCYICRMLICDKNLRPGTGMLRRGQLVAYRMVPLQSTCRSGSVFSRRRPPPLQHSAQPPAPPRQRSQHKWKRSLRPTRKRTLQKWIAGVHPRPRRPTSTQRNPRTNLRRSR